MRGLEFARDVSAEVITLQGRLKVFNAKLLLLLTVIEFEDHLLPIMLMTSQHVLNPLLQLHFVVGHLLLRIDQLSGDLFFLLVGPNVGPEEQQRYLPFVLSDLLLVFKQPSNIRLSLALESGKRI